MKLSSETGKRQENEKQWKVYQRGNGDLLGQIRTTIQILITDQ
jgi:hypothetical protein